MILAIRDRMEKRDEGFTLIELLVVVIIIGILAAVAIPTFLRQRERAWNSATESELRNAAVAIESYATGNNGSYVGADVPALALEGFNQSPAFTAPGVFSVDSATATAYCLEAAHASQPTVFYRLASNEGAPTLGTCP